MSKLKSKPVLQSLNRFIDRFNTSKKQPAQIRSDCKLVVTGIVEEYIEHFNRGKITLHQPIDISILDLEAYVSLTHREMINHFARLQEAGLIILAAGSQLPTKATDRVSLTLHPDIINSTLLT